MRRKYRRIDAKLARAVSWLGSASKLFVEAAKAAFGRLVDVKRVKKDFDRYLDRGSVPCWVRRFVFTGTYLRLPAAA